jgi:hypothetical protein
MEETAGLPDDIVREIISHVSTDVAVLIRCAAACKRWRAVIADISFLCRCSTKNDDSHDPLSLLGFFKHKHGGSPPAFVPGPAASLLGISRSPLTSFVRGTPAGLFYGAEPLIARRGLLLMRLACGGLDEGLVRLAVCSPLTGACDVLPPLDLSSDFGMTCVILTDADCCSSKERRPAFFTVLVIAASYRGNNVDFSLYTFSSVDLSWSEPRNCFGQVHDYQRRRFRVILGKRKAVVCRGIAHWLVTGLPEVEYNHQTITPSVSVPTLATSPYKNLYPKEA